MYKKLLSMLLTLALLVSALPLSALAQEDAPVNEQTIEQPAAPEGTEEPAGDEDPTDPEPPVLTPEELFVAAVALLPTEPVETVTAELLTQLSEGTEQMNALVTEQQLAAITAEEPVEGISEALLQAVQAVLALTARVNELNAAAAAAVEALMVALPAADALTLENEAQVTEAAAAYAALLVEQQALVSDENVALLHAAQAKLAELVARAKAEKVDELIAQLPPAEDIHIDNYADYQDTAALAGSELSTLSDYERAFVTLTAELANVEIAIKASEDAAAVKAKLDALPSTRQDALDKLTFVTTGENSIEKVFEAEEAYQALTETAKAEILAEYAAFGPTLQVAKDLDTIRENGRIVLNPSTVNYVLTVGGNTAQVPTAVWEGIDEALQTAYPLKVKLPTDKTYIKVTEEGSIYPVAATEKDVVVPVYGENATALQEIGTKITFTVLPAQDEDDLGNTAYVEDATITFNKAYTSAKQRMQVDVVFNVGKYAQYAMSRSGVTVALANEAIANMFTVELDNGVTYVKIANSAYETIKNGTYKTKLVYTATIAGKEVTVTTNEIKLVVNNAPEKVKFATQTINTFYYDATADENTGRYRTLSMRSSGNPYLPTDLTLTNKDAESPFTITYDDSDECFTLAVQPGVKLDKSSYKVTFGVNATEFVAPYDVTLTIKAKATPPKNLALHNKTIEILSRSGVSVESYVEQTKRIDMSDIGATGIKLATLATEKENKKYPYQSYFSITSSQVNGSYIHFELSMQDGMTLPENVKTYPVLLSVTFAGTQNTVNLPLKLTYKASTIKLQQSSLQLPQPGVGQATVNYAYYQVTNGIYDNPTALQSYTVNGVADDKRALSIARDTTYFDNDNGKYIYRLSITPTATIAYGTSYKVVLTFTNGQNLKLTVNTKQVQNKLKLGKTSFKLDLANPEDRYQTTLTPSYLLDDTDATLEVQKYDAGTKTWGEATNLLTAQWEEYKSVTFTPGAGLTEGKTKFRVFAPKQGITSDNAATFTVTVTNGKIKMTGKLGLSKVNVLNPYENVTNITNIKLTNMGDVNYTSKFDSIENNPSEWIYTVGGDGEKYLEVSNYGATYAHLKWKQVGSYTMLQNGLKPIKFTLQVRERATGALIAQTKSYTLKLAQNVTIRTPLPGVRLYKQIPYTTASFWIDPWYNGGFYTVDYKTKSVSIKNAEKSNYRAYLIANDEWTKNVNICIGYKNVEAAQRAKTSETITLVLELENGVKPVEVKIKVTNAK